MKTLCPGSHAGLYPGYDWWKPSENRARIFKRWGRRDDAWAPIGLVIYEGERPTGLKRPKLRCPICGRKIKASVYFAHDMDGVGMTIPPHKVKKWWKKKKKESRDGTGRKLR